MAHRRHHLVRHGQSTPASLHRRNQRHLDLQPHRKYAPVSVLIRPNSVSRFPRTVTKLDIIRGTVNARIYQSYPRNLGSSVAYAFSRPRRPAINTITHQRVATFVRPFAQTQRRTAALQRQAICNDRRTRRRTLFSLLQIGKGKPGPRYRETTPASSVRC